MSEDLLTGCVVNDKRWEVRDIVMRKVKGLYLLEDAQLNSKKLLQLTISFAECANRLFWLSFDGPAFPHYYLNAQLYSQHKHHHTWPKLRRYSSFNCFKLFSNTEPPNYYCNLLPIVPVLNIESPPPPPFLFFISLSVSHFLRSISINRTLPSISFSLNYRSLERASNSYWHPLSYIYLLIIFVFSSWSYSMSFVLDSCHCLVLSIESDFSCWNFSLYSSKVLMANLRDDCSSTNLWFFLSHSSSISLSFFAYRSYSYCNFFTIRRSFY